MASSAAKPTGGGFPPVTKQAFPRLSAIASQAFEKDLLKRIKDARSGPIRMASADLFVGPTVGRLTETANLRKLCTNIGSPSGYQTSSALLVVKGRTGLLKGKLLVIGGGHRLIVSTRRMHMGLIPYRLVDLADLIPLDTDVNPLELVHGVLTVNVETTESRPHDFPMMQQVALYGQLRRYFQWKADVFYRQLDIKSRPLSQNNFIEMYQEFQKLPGPRAKNALDFMSGMKPNSMYPLMLGADRLLNAKVVSFLCHLEAVGIGKFNKQSLNVVRSWDTVRIRTKIAEWKSKREQGISFVAQFSAPAKKTTTTKSRKRKSKSKHKKKSNKRAHHASNSETESDAYADADTDAGNTADADAGNTASADTPPAKLVAVTMPPTGWDSYINWSQPGSLPLLNQLEKKIEECLAAERKSSDTDNGATVIEDDNSAQVHLEIVKSVRQSLNSRAGRAHTRSSNKGTPTAAEFDLGKLICNAVTARSKADWKKVGLIVNGGAKRRTISATKKDISKIFKLDWPTDASVMLSVEFLTNWSPKSIEKLYVLDSLFLKNWFESLLVAGKEPLLSLEDPVRNYTCTLNVHHLVWTKDISILPLCGCKHWTMAIVVHLPRLLQQLESRTEDTLPPSSEDATQPRPSVIFLDSLSAEDSAHTKLVPNVLHYLAAAYPGRRSVTFEMLQNALQIIEFRSPQQNNAECGFYVAYHTALVTRNLNVFLQTQHSMIQNYITQSYETFLFATYCDLIQVRLRQLLHRYEKNPNTSITANTFFWNTSETEEQTPTSAPITPLSPAAPLPFTTGDNPQLLNKASDAGRPAPPSILTEAPADEEHTDSTPLPIPIPTTVEAKSHVPGESPERASNTSLPPVLTQIPSTLDSGASPHESSAPQQSAVPSSAMLTTSSPPTPSSSRNIVASLAPRSEAPTPTAPAPSQPPPPVIPSTASPPPAPAQDAISGNPKSSTCNASKTFKGPRLRSVPPPKPKSPQTGPQSAAAPKIISLPSPAGNKMLSTPPVPRRGTKRQPTPSPVQQPPQKKSKQQSKHPSTFTTAVGEALVHLFKEVVPGSEKQVQAVLEEPAVRSAVEKVKDPESLKDVITQKITPTLANRFRGARQNLVNRSPRTTSAVTSVFQHLTATPHSHPSRLANLSSPIPNPPVTFPTFSEIVSEGDLLIKDESDEQVRKEWLELQLKSISLLRKMKEKI